MRAKKLVVCCVLLNPNIFTHFLRAGFIVMVQCFPHQCEFCRTIWKIDFSRCLAMEDLFSKWTSFLSANMLDHKRLLILIKFLLSFSAILITTVDQKCIWVDRSSGRLYEEINFFFLWENRKNAILTSISCKRKPFFPSVVRHENKKVSSTSLVSPDIFLSSRWGVIVHVTLLNYAKIFVGSQTKCKRRSVC